jgi:hypothetical protein
MAVVLALSLLLAGAAPPDSALLTWSAGPLSVNVGEGSPCSALERAEGKPHKGAVVTAFD